jgi:xanthine dehydrogenase YagR molybdenum-binding subunit
MSIMQKVMAKVASLKPDAKPDPLIRDRAAIGQSMRRVDGRRKVMGAATFTAEYHLEGLAYAAIVTSTIARGKIVSIDASEAEQAAGALLVMTHENAPKMKAPPPFGGKKGAAASTLPIMQDASIHWNGEPVAVIVAETQDQAEHAASLVKVEYSPEEALLSFDGNKASAVPPKEIMGEPPMLEIGDAERALSTSAAKVDAIYRTPRYHHNAIEPHATTAVWEEDQLLVFDPSQSLNLFAASLAAVFELPPEKVRVVAPFVGGGFGGKGMAWSHMFLCAAAAKLAKRPVRLALRRADIFRLVGGRTCSEQRVALGADATGQLQSLIHTGVTATVEHTDFPEQFSFPARHLYASKNLSLGQKVVKLDMVANTAMRAPGESIGTFALESALDELAYELNLDPIELRRLNEPSKDPTSGHPFSSRHIVEAYRAGAEKFGWERRPREARARRDGDWWIGQGVATAYYPFYRMPSKAQLRAMADGSIVVHAAAHEMGMGTATVQTQHLADRLGVPVKLVRFEYGDSSFPASAIAGGSTQTASIGAAIIAACEKLQAELQHLARTKHEIKGEEIAATLQKAKKPFIEVTADAAAPLETMKYSMQSYGAQFCEVRVHAVTGEIRIARWVGSFDCGRIINPKTATSQFRGGIIMGIGMALTEASYFDERYGRFTTASLAEYHVPVHLDVPEIDVLYTDIPDEHAPMGAHGIGEIGITGCAAAIANAIYHATGKRIRELPIRLDALL